MSNEQEEKKDASKPATPNTNVTTSDTVDKMSPDKNFDEPLTGSKRLSKEATNNPEDGTAAQKKART